MKQKCSLLLLAVPLFIASCNQGGGSGSWTISFESNGGSEVAAIKVANGEKASKPANPTRDGFDFLGWYCDTVTVTPFDWNLSITSDWTLYAGWKVNGQQPTSSDSSQISTEASRPDPLDLTYTCTGLPTWIQDDDCVIFAWGWGGSDFGGGKWASLTIAGSSASFKATDELDGFLLARCAKGTTTPSWQEKGTGAGRVFNQTENIAVKHGVYEYVCSSWKQYNP